MGLPVAVSAQVQISTDSVSTALGTVIGSFFHESLERQFPADGVAQQQFIDGIKKAFEIKEFDRTYYEGVAEGMKMIDNLQQITANGMPFDASTYLNAFVTAAKGESTGVNPQQADQYISSVQRQLREVSAAKQQAFLDAQAQREGVIKTSSGLLFEVIEEGEGDTPTVNDTVEVMYTGRLADGTVFDSSEPESVSFMVGRLIPGFTEGLQMMKPGGTYRLFIPASLGYGDRGAGNDIPGGAALDFTVKLLEIKNQ